MPAGRCERRRDTRTNCMYVYSMKSGGQACDFHVDVHHAAGILRECRGSDALTRGAHDDSMCTRGRGSCAQRCTRGRARGQRPSGQSRYGNFQDRHRFVPVRGLWFGLLPRRSPCERRISFGGRNPRAGASVSQDTASGRTLLAIAKCKKGPDRFRDLALHSKSGSTTSRSSLRSRPRDPSGPARSRTRRARLRRES